MSKTLTEIRADTDEAKEAQFSEAISDVMKELYESPDYMKAVAIEILDSPNAMIGSVERGITGYQVLSPIITCTESAIERRYLLIDLLSRIVYHLKCNAQTAMLKEWMLKQLPHLEDGGE